MADHIDRLFDEVDRQLGEVRQQCNGVATRAGLLITAIGVAAAVLVANLERVKGGEIAAFSALGVATLLGIAALVPALAVGPETVSLTRWADDSEDQAIAELYLAKLIVLDANQTRLALMTWAFYFQGVAVIVAVVLALVVSAGR